MDNNIIKDNEILRSHQSLNEQEEEETQKRSMQSVHEFFANSTPQQRIPLTHFYDPNMCTTAARFSDSFYKKNATTTEAGAAMATATQCSSLADVSHHSQHTAADENLLTYKRNALLMQETTQKIGAEAIVTNHDCATAEEVTMTPTLHIHSLSSHQMHVPEEAFVTNYHYMNFDQTSLPPHEPVGTTAPTEHDLLTGHRLSSHGHFNEQTYLLNVAQHTEDGKENDEQCVSLQTTHIDRMFPTHLNAVETHTVPHLQSFELPTQYVSFHQHGAAPDDNSVELIARYAADLASVPSVHSDHYETQMDRQLALAAKDEQRLLLESTMSPLLAAVNDITKRDAELHLYFNQPLEKEPPPMHYLETLNKTEAKKSNASTPQSSSDEEEDYLLVSDRTVECRAKASLPTKYLYFRKTNDNATNDLSVFAKKPIPRRTMFGPYEGQALFASEIDLDVMHMQTTRCYPVLMIDDTHILDVSNEERSNWMRYIRLAQTFAEQNLQLLLRERKIYLRSTRDIPAKEELRIGYHRAYAVRFMLSTPQPTLNDLKFERFQKALMHKKRFSYEQSRLKTTAAASRIRNNKKKADHDLENQKPLAGGLNRFQSCTRKSCRKRKTDSTKEREVVGGREEEEEEKGGERKSQKLSTVTIRKNGFHRRLSIAEDYNLTDDIMFTQQVMRAKRRRQRFKKARKNKGQQQQCPLKENSKNDKTKELKCNLCAKRFSKESMYTKHKETHANNLNKPYQCSICAQQCATPAALTAHIKGHETTLYACIFCEQKFKYVRDFKQHVQTHKIAEPNGYFECIHCKKHYAAYHLVRKHVRIFHSNKEAECYICGKKFQNASTLQRHRLTHKERRSYGCAKCNKIFRRKDHLISHTKRKHNFETEREEKETKSGKSSKAENEAVFEQIDCQKIPPLAANNNENQQKTQSDNLTPPKPAAASATAAVSTSTLSSSSSSSSNRRKQTPTKLKALELNAETVTLVALPELLSPFIISELSNTLDVNYRKETGPKTVDMMKDNINTTILNTSKEHCVSIDDCIDNNNRLNSSHAAENVEQHQTPPLAANARKLETFASKAISPLYPFSCHICEHMSFKRRGMLVNHMAKVHPFVDVKEMAILNAPIVRQELIFLCPYCTKVYKLNAKRKAHIIKHHPGQELPVSMRQSRAQAVAAAQPPTTPAALQHSTEVVAAVVGPVEVRIHKCNCCHKQYAARSRLLCHYRKAHPKYKNLTPFPQQHEDDADDADNFMREHLDGSQQVVQLDTCNDDISPYHSHTPSSPENKLLKLSSAAALELSRFEDDDFFNDQRIRGNDGNDDVAFADSAPQSHTDLQHLPTLFEESSLVTSMEKYNRSIETQFFEKVAKFS